MGTTDERSVCDACCKSGLKKVVVLRDGDTDMFVGVCCAARLTGRAAAWVARKAETVQTANVAAARSDDWAAIMDATHYNMLKNALFNEGFAVHAPRALDRIVAQTGLVRGRVLELCSARWGADRTAFLA